MLQKISYLIVCCSVGLLSMAQKPFVTGIDKTSATPNEQVVISGSGFNSPTIFFGNGRVTNVVSSTANTLVVVVPPTATYGPVRVRNSNGRIAESSFLFFPAFDKDDGSNSYSPAAPAAGITTNQQLPYDICTCDFDGDNLLDAVITNSNANSILTIVRNNPIPAPSFVLTDYDDPDHDNLPLNIECGDLNGDNRPEIIVTSGGSGEPFIHIYENISTVGTISFQKRQRLQLPTLNAIQRSPNRVRIADFDGDGKPDLAVGTNTDNDPSFFVFLNNYTTIPSFVATPIAIRHGEAIPMGVIYPGDFDRDGKIDLAVASSNVNGNIIIMENTSLPGQISFTRRSAVGGAATRPNMLVADFNNDGFPDIASARRTGADGGTLEILENDGNFGFTARINSGNSSISPWGLDAGDMNGDGWADVVVASLSNEIVYYENTTSSVGGAINFASGTNRTTSQARNVKVADVNNDGKPDIVFTDRAVSSEATGDFRYIINNECMNPVIQPTSGTYCNGTSFILRATAGQGVTYSWTITGDTPSPVSTGTNNTLDLTGYDQNISVVVTATSPDGCVIGSSSRSFTVGSASVGAPTINDPGVICVGDALNLSTPNTGLANYYWTGPNGFTGTNNSTVSVSGSATLAHAGVYTLSVDDGDCLSPVATRTIIVSAPPPTAIEYQSCDNNIVTLSVPDYSAQFSYLWFRNGVSTGQTSASINVSTLGEYTVVLTDGNTCETESLGFDLLASTFSGPSFDAPNEVCVDVETTFTSGQSGTSDTWEIEDPAGSPAVTLNGASVNYTFSTTGNKVVRLITRYEDGVGCSEKNIVVSAEPNFTADISGGSTTKCPSDEVTLSFSEFGGEIISVEWDSLGTPVTKNALVVREAGSYVATYTTDAGCEISAPAVVITNHPTLGLASANPAIVDGTVTMDRGQTSVDLSIDGDNTGITWELIEGNGTFSGSTTSNQVTVFPSSPTITVQVTGTTTEGCTETETLNIVSGGFLARKSFSPNGDGTNDCWGIVNSSNLQGCVVSILDSRGALIGKFNSPFVDDCIWDGTYNNNDVPEGVYFFVMKCAEGANSQTGSILLAR